MSDSEDEVLGRKKPCQPLINSDEDVCEEVFYCKSDVYHQSQLETSAKSVEFSCETSKNFSRRERPDCASNNETPMVNPKISECQSPKSSETDHRNQNGSRVMSSSSSAKRNSCSNSNGPSDSDSETENSGSILINHQNKFPTSYRMTSPDSTCNSSTDSTLVRNINVKNKKSFSPLSELDVCYERMSDGPVASLNSVQSSSKQKISKDSINLEITSDYMEDNEKVVRERTKKYKLLSDDDLSEDGEIHSTFNIERSMSRTNSDVLSLDPNKKLKLEKQTRKRKFQKLNELKKQERITKSENSSSDSDCDDGEIPNSLQSNQNFKSRNSATDSDSPDSENEEKKSKNKSGRTSHSRPKSKKLDPMLEIKSKTQKMIRENRISLPYHQPKKRSLDEFLQRRRNALSLPLKTTTDVLHVVSEHLLKREKEVALFYKSESDHSDEETITAVGHVDQYLCNVTNAAENCEDLSKKMDVSVSKAADVILFETALPDSSINDVNKVNDNTDLRNENEENFRNIVRLTEMDENTSQNDFRSENDWSKRRETSSTNAELGSADDADAACEGRETSICFENRDQSNSWCLGQPEDSPEKMPCFGKKICCDNEVQTYTIPNSVSLSDNDSFDLIVQNDEESVVADSSNEETASVPKQTLSIEGRVIDTDDFDLTVQDSCDQVKGNFDSELPASNKKITDLRSQKLALLSRLKIPLRNDVKLVDSSPDALIEFETPVLSKSELGIYELKKKFSYHATMRNTSTKKSSAKLSVVRTETDSQGDIINVFKEIIEFTAAGEGTGDSEEKQYSTPGAKHLNFREQMLKTLVAKKQAKWQEYQREKRKLYEEERSSEDEELDKYDQYSQKPDFEPYHPEDELDDDELLEDDIQLEDKQSKKNDFVDDEAEVSDDEDEMANDESDDDDDAEIENENVVDELADDVNEVDDADKDENEQKDETVVDQSRSEIVSVDVFKKPIPSQNGPLFTYNITGTDLENKVLGLESMFSQKSHVGDEVTSTQLFDICSGKFGTQIDRLNASDPSDMEFFADSQNAEDSQNFNLSLQDTNDGFSGTNHNVSDSRNLLLLSDESDTEDLFTRKRKLMQLEDTDDEADANATASNVKPGNEEVCNADDDNVDEFGDGQDEHDEVDALVNDDDDDDEELAYNSEEEIIVKKKAQEFFENEAELSESEWGSEDENENDLDELEKEAGDDEVLDEDALKAELGKIHMRQMLDDDQNDVRMLKELLLEDGELHSDGKRQRKFQWTNLDDGAFFTKSVNDSDDEALNEDDEEETDANWRKIRHEREMYLSQQEKKNLPIEVVGDEISDSLPQPAFNPTVARSVANDKSGVVLTNNNASPDLKLPFKARFKCGSFLTRSKMLLNRIAVTVGECKDNVTGGAKKNHRNFVFATVSPERELPDVPDAKTEKRKISSKFVVARKKLKLTPSLNKGGLLAQLALSD